MLRWSAVSPGVHRECIALINGADHYVDVDIAVKSRVAVCDCGRLRYAEPKNTHEIWACRICTQTAARKRRRQQRKRPTDRRRKLSGADVSTMQQLRRQGCSLLDLAVEFGVDPSTVSRALKRARACAA